MKKSEKQPEATQPKSKTCTKCNIEKPIEDFRTHKSGYVLNQCREREKKTAFARIQAKKGTPSSATPESPTTFTIKTKKGKEFTVSTEPFAGARMVTNGEHTVYFTFGTGKDVARSAFISFYGPYL